jgi:hypothetical protein
MFIGSSVFSLHQLLYADEGWGFVGLKGIASVQGRQVCPGLRLPYPTETEDVSNPFGEGDADALGAGFEVCAA